MDDARTGHADVDHSFRFTQTMKRARHERIVLDRVRETDKLRAGKSTLVSRSLSGVLEDSAHLGYHVHVDARSRRRSINGRAQTLGGRECFRYRVKKAFFRLRRALLDQR